MGGGCQGGLLGVWVVRFQKFLVDCWVLGEKKRRREREHDHTRLLLVYEGWKRAVMLRAECLER